jgi:hypothetical protein
MPPPDQIQHPSKDRRAAASPKPKAREEDLLIECLEADGEILIYDLRTHQAHCLNRMAALVWRHCDGERTIPQLCQHLSQEAAWCGRQEVVYLALQRLGGAGLLLRPVPRPPEECRVSRRAIALQLGLTGALAALLPAVQSIVAPTAAAAASCLPNSECAAGRTGMCCCDPSLGTNDNPLVLGRRTCVNDNGVHACNGTLC